MRVARGTVDHRQQQRAQHVAHLRRVGAGIPQRGLRDERIEQVRLLEKINEEHQLAQRRQGLVGSPLDCDPAGKTVQRDGLPNTCRRARSTLTRRVRQSLSIL